jgi:PmbA protein
MQQVIQNLDLTKLDQLKQLTADILQKAKLQGASQAEVGIGVEKGLATTVRIGEVETLEFHQEQGVGITVYFGKCKGTASTADLHPDSIEEAIRAACNIAQYTMADECSGLADADLMAYGYPELNLYYPSTIHAEAAIEMATECEALARQADKRITNSEGASVNTHESLHIYGNSHGFIGGYPTSRYSMTCVLIGESKGAMQRDYWYTLARDPALLETPKQVAHHAAQRTVARLGARRIKTGKYPVIYQADAARGLLGNFIQAIQGSSLYRESSFLLDMLDKPVFAPWVQIDEDPYVIGGLASVPYDAEGVRPVARSIVQDGVLQTYLLSSYSGRKLNMPTTGNAGGVHNLFIRSGEHDLDGLLKKMGTGLFLTELMGQGVQIINGDYSRGATGFWVENGVIQFPVEEITLAGNLRDMFMNILEVGTDIDKRSGVQTGSWLLPEMMVAGE